MESFSAETNSTERLSQTSNEPQVILSMVILGFTFLLGLPGNGLVLWVAGLKMQRTVNTVWFLHLTVADFLCCLSLPFSLAHLALQGHWPYGWLLCKVIPSIIILNMFASVFLLTAISLDRCLVVLKPIWCQNHRNVRTTFAICGCIWVVAFAMCIPVFLYREIFTVDNHNVCSYKFYASSSLDYLDIDLLENGFLDDFIAQLPGKMADRLDSSSFYTNNSTSTDLHHQTFQRPFRDSPPMNLSRLSSQYSYYDLFKFADMVFPTIPNGLPRFPSEDGRTDSLDNADALLSTDLPHVSRNSLYTYELSYNYYGGNFSQFTYENHVPTPLLVITFTRLVVGFLLPTIIMVACYTLIICRMHRGRFSKSRGKTLQVAMVVVVVFLFCWTPYHIIGVLRLFIDPETPFGEALGSWDHISIALASANSCFNPFLYALLGKDFRKKAKQSMQGILERAFSEELTHSTSCTQNISLERNSVSTAV
ncbi:PREDICTED: C3a anaphylatoxin chemotactic receptor [Chrysochloris asiatica]|uniref:C3a anaphylatoxin chemotactic receptor n=1 Tax=Chrysochloris asiatica TaxID=185453 RepID=A0A9B0UAW3_CHRAS|nr:PREDICTED: C3a anaphylatoxin chemotactic receptor [Chrysochloris asiatica]